MDRDRARGALVGLAVGDALGTTLEFTRPSPPPRGQRLAGPHRDITGGGPFHVAPGQVTDDTHMACCLAASLKQHSGIDRADLARRYLAWSSVSFDVGGTTRAAMALLEVERLDAGRILWERGGRTAAPNGSLMRTAPIGVYFAAQEEIRREASFDDSCLTHFDPRCQLACAAFNAAIAAAICRAADAAAMRQGAEAELAAGAAMLRRRHSDLEDVVELARAALTDDLAAATDPDPDIYGPTVHLHRHEGFVRVAFRLAFWELLHADGVEDGLVDVVNRGGDADTNGAIAGALLGALHGEHGIPAAWRERVLDAQPEGAPAFRDAYHPRRLLALVPEDGRTS